MVKKAKKQNTACWDLPHWKRLTLTWWHVMSKADHTHIPEMAWAAVVLRNIWSVMLPLLVWMMVMLGKSVFSGRIGMSRWTMESFPADEFMAAVERFICSCTANSEGRDGRGCEVKGSLLISAHVTVLGFYNEK